MHWPNKAIIPFFLPSPDSLLSLCKERNNNETQRTTLSARLVENLSVHQTPAICQVEVVYSLEESENECFFFALAVVHAR